MTPLRLGAFLATLLVTAPASADDLDMTILGRPEIVRPRGAPTAAAALFSGASGWGAAERALAAELAARGTVVIGIDTPATLARIAKSGEDCVWVIGEIEAVSHAVQRELGASAYRLPAIVGIGAGGAFAQAVATQTEAATVDRIVAIDPGAPPPEMKRLCSTPTRVSAEVVASGTATPEDTLRAALARTQPMDTDALADLPLEVLPVAQRSDAFAVFYSGDGGWRDLDKDLAAVLQKQGLPVVGVDSLRYFWKRRTPEQTAADLARIVRAYRGKWGATRVALIGFSFGADILPPAVNRLPAEIRADVAQISLLAFSSVADFEVTVGSWLDRKSDASLPSLPEARRLAPERVQCFYGAEDEDAACAQLAGSGIEIVRTSGGHHFDGDTAALARRILDGLARRSLTPRS